MSRNVTWSVLTAMCAFLGACDLSDREVRSLNAWLSCEECREGERDSVRVLGSPVVPALATALTQGPSNARKIEMSRQFTASYPAAGIPGVSQAEYVARLDSNFVATFQERAALSLADIGGDRAMQALGEVIANPSGYRADVVATVQYLLLSGRVPSFVGTLRPRIVRFGDTIRALLPLGRTFSGDEVAALSGSRFSANDLTLLNRPNELVFAAVAPEGPVSVLLMNVEAPGDSMVGAVAMVSLHDRNDRRMLGCTDFACVAANAEEIAETALPLHTFISLHRKGPRPDTLDIYRIQAAAERRITATLRWPGTADLDLRWRGCAPTHASVGNSDGATTTQNPETTSVTIPPGECWLLIATHRSSADQTVFAKLSVESP